MACLSCFSATFKEDTQGWENPKIKVCQGTLAWVGSQVEWVGLAKAVHLTSWIGENSCLRKNKNLLKLSSRKRRWPTAWRQLVLELTLGHQWGSLVPAVPARAPLASSPPPCASAPHSAGAAPAPAAFAAPSPASVAVGQEADNPEGTGHNGDGRCWETSRESCRTSDVSS